MISVHFQGKQFNITVIQVYAPINNAKEAEQFYDDLQDLIELTPKKGPFIIGDWNAKVRCQEIPGLIVKFGPGVQNEAGQSLTEFCEENTLVTANTLFPNNTRDDTTYGHHQMVKTEIKLITFSEAEYGEVGYSQQRQDLDPTVATIISPLMQNSGLN